MSAVLVKHWCERSFLQSSHFSDWLEPPEPDFKVVRKPKEKVSIPRTIPTETRRICGIAIPTAITHIADAVEKSEYILKLPDDWDDEGSPHYEQETWDRAVTFVLNNSSALWRKEGVRPVAPAIQHGPRGSIDIHWKAPMKELLINVSPSHDQPATYYGMNKTTRVDTKGKLDISEVNEWLLMWITEK